MTNIRREPYDVEIPSNELLFNGNYIYIKRNNIDFRVARSSTISFLLHDCFTFDGYQQIQIIDQTVWIFPQAHTSMLSHPCEIVSFVHCEFDASNTFCLSVLITYRTKLLIIFLPPQTLTRFRYSDGYSNFAPAVTTLLSILPP